MSLFDCNVNLIFVVYFALAKNIFFKVLIKFYSCLNGREVLMQFLYNMCTLLICLHFLCSRFCFACMVLKNALTHNTLNVNVLRTFGRQNVMSAVIWLTSGIWVFHWCRLADTDWRPKTDQKTTGHHASTNNFYLLDSVNKLYMSLKSSIISTVLLQLR